MIETFKTMRPTMEQMFMCFRYKKLILEQIGINNEIQN